MKFDKMLFPVLATVALTAIVPEAAVAQRRGTAAQRAANAEATADMRSRIAAADERVVVTQRHGKLTSARTRELRRQLAQAQQEIARLTRRQGFLSAAQLRTYDRMVVALDTELGDAAVRQGYGNDALPSAEVTAFQRTDARLRYRNARIDYDAQRCAVYQGTAPNGRVRREPLRDPAGRPICARR